MSPATNSRTIEKTWEPLLRKAVTFFYERFSKKRVSADLFVSNRIYIFKIINSFYNLICHVHSIKDHT